MPNPTKFVRQVLCALAAYMCAKFCCRCGIQSQGRKFMSCSHSQELGQLDSLASDWLYTLVQPIRCQLRVLTQYLTTTITHKFPS